jgi:shikimate kinase
MKNIVLVGFMGTGKTTVGRLIAQDLNRQFITTDDLIEKKAHMSINDIFEKKGEPYFRELEREVIVEVSKKHDVVIDAGGGVVINELNVKDLKANGDIFCLNAEPNEILKRVEKYKHRPLLSDVLDKVGEIGNQLLEIRRLLKEREEYYKRADYQIDTNGKSIKEVSREIIEIYKNSIG